MDILLVSAGAGAEEVVSVTAVLSVVLLLEPELLWQATANKPRARAKMLTFNAFFIFKSF